MCLEFREAWAQGKFIGPEKGFKATALARTLMGPRSATRPGGSGRGVAGQELLVETNEHRLGAEAAAISPSDLEDGGAHSRGQQGCAPSAGSRAGPSCLFWPLVLLDPEVPWRAHALLCSLPLSSHGLLPGCVCASSFRKDTSHWINSQPMRVPSHLS